MRNGRVSSCRAPQSLPIQLPESSHHGSGEGTAATTPARECRGPRSSGILAQGMHLPQGRCGTCLGPPHNQNLAVPSPSARYPGRSLKLAQCASLGPDLRGGIASYWSHSPTKSSAEAPPLVGSAAGLSLRLPVRRRVTCSGCPCLAAGWRGPIPCRLLAPPDLVPEGTISQRARRAGRGPSRRYLPRCRPKQNRRVLIPRPPQGGRNSIRVNLRLHFG